MCTRAAVPTTLMEGSLVPGECIRGIFGMIWGSGGCSLGKPYLGNPSRAGNWAGRVVW